MVAARRHADAVDAHVVRVRRAGGAVQHALAEQVVGARVGHATEQLTPVLRPDCRWKTDMGGELNSVTGLSVEGGHGWRVK